MIINIFKNFHIILSVLFLYLVFSVLTNNLNAKKYTSSNEMLETDWSDPKELELTWTNSVIQIPIKKGKSKKSNLKKLIKEFNNTLKRTI